jgi:leader peptidase (prepilin peptidase)/N-methyltransferase
MFKFEAPSTGLFAIIVGMIMLIPVLLAGWLAGIIVNYLADVLPLQRRLTKPFCLSCRTEQNWRRYLLWPRRCDQCHAPRSTRTYIVEIFFILASIYLWKIKLDGISYLPGLVLAVYFGVVAVIDIEHRLILHPVSIVGFVLGTIYGVLLHGLKSTLIGGAVGFASMLLIYIMGIGYVRLAGWLGRPTDEVALGYGDVNLSGVIGLLLGWPGVGAGLVITILLSGLISLGYIVVMKCRRQYSPDLALPFGPFFVASAVILIYLKDAIYWVWSMLYRI